MRELCVECRFTCKLKKDTNLDPERAFELAQNCPQAVQEVSASNDIIAADAQEESRFNPNSPQRNSH